WQSTNGGKTWTLLTNGLPAASPTIGRIGLAIAPSSPSTVYAVYSDDPGNFMGVWKTTNAGATWARSDSGPGLSNAGYYFSQVRVDPANAQTVYLVDASLWKSTDGGGRFTARAHGLHSDEHDMALAPGGRAYLAGDGGAYWTTSGPDSWTQSSVLAITQ